MRPTVDFAVCAIVGGNCSNGANCGASYVNLNNSASNASWNIGASPSCQKSSSFYNARYIPGRLAEIKPKEGLC